MILLKKARLINWYAFTHETAPIGYFTLVAGKNGNGKSVFLDALKYGAFGDTVFNKSSEGKGSRTLITYTRGLIDATAGTYIRPAEKVPNVYSHIVLEFYDDLEKKSFLLGTILETNASGNIQTARYVMDHAALDDVSHVYEDKDVVKPYNISGFQKAYGVTMFTNKEQGIAKFTQLTGLRFTSDQTQTYLRKLRGIMSYDPDARIDQFIRESVLEKRTVDFTKLIEARENIGRLTDTMNDIRREISDLESILEEFDAWENQKNRLLTDDIKIVYKDILELKNGIEQQTAAMELCRKESEEAAKKVLECQAAEEGFNRQLMEAGNALRNVDGTELINQEEDRLKELGEHKEKLVLQKKKLEEFQDRVNEMLKLLYDNGPDEDMAVLRSLSGPEYSDAEKSHAVEGLKKKLQDKRDSILIRINSTYNHIMETDDSLAEVLRKLESIKARIGDFSDIPDYAGLRDEINRELEKRGLPKGARFACEFVKSLKDEKWRDTLEAFLGRRRYTILVEPEYYDIADDVLNHTKFRRAHIFNTKLLMRREVNCVEDSAADLIEVTNETARKYFDFQLGRMHAVTIESVKEYENAMSPEGRVSVAMDSYFLDFKRIRSYYLGQEAFELNRIRAEKQAEKLRQTGQELRKENEENKASCRNMELYLEMFGQYNYSASAELGKTMENIRECMETLQRLKDAQANNLEYMELMQQCARVEQALEAEKKKRVEADMKRMENSNRASDLNRQIASKKDSLAERQLEFDEYCTSDYVAVKKATEAYDRFLANGRTGSGGIVQRETRIRIEREIEARYGKLMSLQGEYNAHYPENQLLPGVETKTLYAERKNLIWMDDLQDVEQHLQEQTRRYEDIFKNEFVLSIYRSCGKAQSDIKEINHELSKLKFSARYEFDVKYIKDGTDFSKIIEYAGFLDEREQLGSSEGQMVFGKLTDYSREDEERMESDIKDIINRMINSNRPEIIESFADYRNYMTYEIRISNERLDRAKLSRQTRYNSGAEVQIPYLLILTSALLMIYNEKRNCARLVFIDEPFAKMDPANVKTMLSFLRNQNLQVIFCAPDKTESIGSECEVILPVLRVSTELMQMGKFRFHDDKCYKQTK